MALVLDTQADKAVQSTPATQASALLSQSNQAKKTATGTGTSSIGKKTPGVIEQTERLLTVRTRGASSTVKDGGDRGQRGYIKLITTDANKTLSRTKAIDAVKTTSIGDASGGVLFDAVSDTTKVKYGGYASFLITDVQAQMTEKLQIVETFGDAEVTYYFGRAPMVFNISGVVIDSVDNNWFVQWLEMYGSTLRGTQLARNYELVKLVLPNMQLIGTISSTTFNQNSANDTNIAFGFQFLVKQLIPTPVIPLQAALTNDFQQINFSSVANFTTKKELNSKKEEISKLAATLQNPSSSNRDVRNAVLSIGNRSAQTDPATMDISGNVIKASSGASSSSDMFGSVSAALLGVRASMFSPVYGVLGSLAKLIRTTSSKVNSLISSLTNPVKNILRDIRNIASQAIGIVNLVTSAIDTVSGMIRGIDNDIAQTLSTLTKAAGVITHAPETIGQSLQRLVNAGRFPATIGFLQNGNKGATLSYGTRPVNKLALLNAGARFSPGKAAFI